MMKEMRSNVCKRANQLVKTGYYTKSRAFRQAWEEVKKAAMKVKAENLTAGTSLRIEYGCYGNFVTCTVVEVSKSLYLGRYYKVKAVYTNGKEFEFCARTNEVFAKAA